MTDNPFVGTCTYRSFLSEPNRDRAFNDLEFGRDTIVIDNGPMQSLKGMTGGPDWLLALNGFRSYGNPMHAHFLGHRCRKRRDPDPRLCRLYRVAQTS